MSQSSNQAGKGMTPRKGYNPRAYRDNWERAFGKVKCAVCGDPLRPNDFTGMRAYWVGGKAYHAAEACGAPNGPDDQASDS